MKILYHHRTKSRDGQYVHISELQAAFRRLGHEIVEVAPAKEEEVAFGEESRSLARITKFVPSGLREVLEWGYNWVSYRGLVRAIRERRPDVIYERYALGNIAGVRASKKFGIPLIVEVNAPLAWERARYGGLTFPRMAQRLESHVLSRADRVIAVTEVMRGILIEEGAHPERTVVMPNGVHIPDFDRAPSLEAAKEALGLSGRVVLGFAGFCRDWHGLDRVISLLARGEASLEGAHLLIVGDGPVRESLLRQAKEEGLEERVTITGVVPRERLTEYIAAFDVALQPAVVDYASPLKLFEYMVMGKAIVAPDKENIREVVDHDRSAFLFDADDEQAFQDAVLRLAGDAGLRDRLGRGAREEVETRPLTWDHNAQRVEELWHQIAGAGALTC